MEESKELSNTDEFELVKIYKTTDYKKFQFFGENRDSILRKSLVQSIQRNDKLKMHEIIVNKSLYVIDGQHRLLAAEFLKVPIYYRIDEEYKPDDMASMNSSNQSWKTGNFIYHFNKRNFDGFDFFVSTIEKYKISVNSFCRVFVKDWSKGKSSPRTLLKHGVLRLKYNHDKIDFCCWSANLIKKEIKKFFPKTNLRGNSEIALLAIPLKENFNCNRFVEAINNYPDKLGDAFKFKRQADIQNFLIEEVYNKRLKKENRIQT